MTMAGQAVYRWATTKLTATLEQAMEQAGVAPADIDVFAPHQANLRIIESMAKRLGFAPDTVGRPRHRPVGQHLGRLDPAGADRADGVRRGQVRRLALVLGYGAGLTFAGQVILAP